uniref:Uncharacterized protein n=1 Tax=Daphnia galeata TaxID=27404 RepID=A0A8J2WJW7_9CRUS|nr:unnamed protein product [Daphnia galeata]
MESTKANAHSTRSKEFITKSLLAGGVAGMFSKTTVAPLDRVKILLQAHNKHYKQQGVFSGLVKIVKFENLWALYKGNGAQMVRIFPYAATQFTSYEVYKPIFGNMMSQHHFSKFLSGSAAGITAVLLTYPLDTIRARLAFQITGEHKYSGITHTAITMFKEEGGGKALYRGFTPTVIGMIPYAGLSFYCFEGLKYCCMKHLPQWTCEPCPINSGGLVLKLTAKLLCGGFAGAIAQSFAYPFDVTRRRMQLAQMTADKHHWGGLGMTGTLVQIYRREGIIYGLYRGMSINYLRAIPMVAVSFTTYELMKQMLKLDTGIKIE